MAETKKKTAVLISGRGSNLEALMKAAEAADYPAEIALVLSTKGDSPGLRHAKDKGIVTGVLHEKWETKTEFELNLDAVLQDAAVEIVCLAGFMRILSKRFVDAWRDRILNIHPSLLPLFPGLNTHSRALAAGVRFHGATVHFVRAQVDAGPIVTQGVVPVLSDDTPEVLADRVLRVEHRIYPLALDLVASGRAKIREERVLLSDVEATPEASLLSPPD